MTRTRIHGEQQIQTETITNDQISAAAGIELTKLEKAVLAADGSVPAAADIPMGSHKITGLQDPTSAQDAATKKYVDDLAQGLDVKASVRVATTTNGTLATAFQNGSTVDGVTLATGDRILIKNQSTASQNGIYTVNASGAPTRATDADSSAKVTSGMYCFVEEGTANGDTGWVLTTNQTITLGSTSLTFTKFSGVGAGQDWVDKETPSGLVNDVNVTYTLANTPISGSVHLYLNGILQDEGSGNDFTISGATITMEAAPQTGSKLRASYRK